MHILNVRQSAFARQIELVNSKTPSNSKALISNYNHSASIEDDDESGDPTIVLRPGMFVILSYLFALKQQINLHFSCIFCT